MNEFAHLHSIDLVILVLYFCGILVLGIYLGRFVKSSEDYFLGGRMLSWWAIGMGTVVADIGATDFIGLSGGAYRFGIALANFDWGAGVTPLILSALIFIPYYYRAGVYTVPEYLGRRYRPSVQTLQAVLWGTFMVCNIGILLWATAILLTTMLGWSMEFSVLLTAGVVLIYVIAGGLIAITMNDVIHMIVMSIGGVAILFLGYSMVGGWTGLTASLAAMGPAYEHHLDLFLPLDSASPYPWLAVVLGLMIVQGPAYWFSNQVVIQKTLCARDEWNAKAGMLFAAMLKALIPFILVVPGLFALVLFPNLTDPDQAFPMLIKNILPPGLVGLVTAAFFAALLSSVEAYVSSAATMWTKDIYQRFIRPDAETGHYLLVGRILTFAFIVLGVLFALLRIPIYFQGIYSLFQTLLSVFLGPTLAILLAGMFWRRATGAGGLWGLVAGIGMACSLYYWQDTFFTLQEPFLYISWWAFCAGLIATILISLVTPPEPEEKLVGLVYGEVVKSPGVQAVLRRRATGGEPNGGDDAA